MHMAHTGMHTRIAQPNGTLIITKRRALRSVTLQNDTVNICKAYVCGPFLCAPDHSTRVESMQFEPI